MCLIAFVAGGVATIMKSSIENEKVSAHPAQEIILNNTPPNDFTVPIDGGPAFEDALVNPPLQLQGYRQNDAIVPILEKKHVDGTGVSNSVTGTLVSVIRGIEKTAGGNYVVLYGFGSSGTGGLIKVAVYNKEGFMLAEDLHGQLGNINLRVNTGFYNVGNNAYLVGTQEGSFFRYTISGESATTATITRTKLTVPNNPNTNMKANFHQKINTFSTYSDNSMIVGRINTSQSNYEGVVKHRVPVASINVSGWGGSGFSGASTYMYSLENLLNTDPLINLPNVGVQVETTATNTFYNSTGKLYGNFSNMQYDGTTVRSVNSIQIFDTNENVTDPGTGQNIKKRKFAYVANRTLLILAEICTDDHMYFLDLKSDKTELIEVDLNTYSFAPIMTFPKDTRIRMIDNGDGTISYFGSTSALVDSFYSNYYSNKLTGSNFFVSGLMKDLTDTAPLETISIRAFETNGYVYPDSVIDSGNNQLFIGGTTNDKDIFIDDLHLYTGATPPTSIGEPSANMAFVGQIEINDDYSPAIKAENNIEVDITNNSIINPSDTNYRGWTTLDRWLITGKVDGLVTDADAVKVYDYMDNNDLGFGATAQIREENLQTLINRNPKNPSDPINWTALGFDKTKTGPQQVTYFITDSQLQASTTSRWINKTTPQTEKKDEYYLDAQNFHIPLDGISTAIPNGEEFKKLAKTMAWNGATGQLDEDGTDNTKLSPDKVKIDSTQLAALQNATEAKPYPVDVVYEPVAGGTKVTNRVWVFPTVKNTLPNNGITPEIGPDETNGVVYYADDYSMPFRMRHTHTDDDVRSRGNIRVYNYYDADNETSAVLPTIVDMNNVTDRQKVEIRTINQVRNAPQPGILAPPISVVYKWDKGTDTQHTDGVETIGSLDITLFSDVLLHVRQIVRQPSDEIVVPDEGYVTIKNTLNNSGTPVLDPNYHSQVAVSSGKQETTLDFTTFAVETDHLTNGLDEVNLTAVVPEFYQYIGYYLTDQANDPSGASHKSNAPLPTLVSGNIALSRMDINDREEFWLTIYLEPIKKQGTTDNKTPQPYSWDYKHNNLGKIKPK